MTDTTDILRIQALLLSMYRAHQSDDSSINGFFNKKDGLLLYNYYLYGMETLKISNGFQGERAFILPPAVRMRLAEMPETSLLHVTDIGYYPNAKSHYCMRTEPIDQYIFIFCVKGKGWYELDGRRFEVNSKDFFIIPPGTPHSYGADVDSPWTIYWIHFRGTCASVYVPYGNGVLTFTEKAWINIHLLLNRFEDMMNTLEKGYNAESLIYTSSVLHHFFGTMRLMYRTPEMIGAPVDSDASDVISYSIKLMNENIGRTLRISELASYFGYSSAYYSTLFSKSTGMTPAAYQIQLKMIRACSLLDFTDLRINQICHMVGIEDPYYFTRVFTKIMGVSPKSYRSDKKG